MTNLYRRLSKDVSYQISIHLAKRFFYNSLMYGVNASIVSKLQHVQNTAARLVTREKKYEHITPTLVALHWLPFKF
jgi:hypothetical protein